MLTEERCNDLVNWAVLTVFALADRREPPSLDDIGEMDAAETWGCICAALEIAKHLLGGNEPGAFASVHQLRSATEAEIAAGRGCLLAAQITATYCNGDPATSLALWRAERDPDVWVKAMVEVFRLTSVLVRDHPSRQEVRRGA